MDKDLGTIAICAVRYALGRQSYMSGIVQDFVMRYPEIVDARVKNAMLNDIMTADRIVKYGLSDGSEMTVDGLGDSRIDRPGWIRFKEWLESLDVGGEADGKGMH